MSFTSGSNSLANLATARKLYFTNYCSEFDHSSIEALRIKAEKGGAAAQLSLGLCYFQGISLDHAEAFKRAQAAAAHGFAPWECVLGIAYQWGVGVRPDPSEAVKWYHRAGEHGDTVARTYLGCCYNP
jgi:TPR repeat protein